MDKRADLEADFSIEELQTAIEDLKNGKSPGPDRFSIRLYKTFTDHLALFCLTVCNSVSHNCPFPSQSLTAHFSVIPKPGKVHNYSSNYRPISLINIDLKLQYMPK